MCMYIYIYTYPAGARGRSDCLHRAGRGLSYGRLSTVIKYIYTYMYHCFKVTNICVYTYVYTYIYIYIYIYIRTGTTGETSAGGQNVCIYVCMYVCMHACMHVCMYVCMFM